MQTLSLWRVLTHFPAGYSLYAAALTALGVGPRWFVKISGAIATLVGWWGWGRLAFSYMTDGWRRSRFGRLAAYSIAIVSPLLFTSRWGGTDIILWAAIPWVLLLITRPPTHGAKANFRSDVLAGFLMGLSVLARYASVFIAAYAISVIACQCRLRVTLTAKRLTSLVAGMLPAVAIQGYINYFVAPDAARLGGVAFSRDTLAGAGVRVWESVTSLGAANHGLFFWVPGRFRWWAETIYEPAALAFACAVLIVPVVILVAGRSLPASAWCHDLRIVGAGMLIGLPLFLWICGIFGTYAYVRDARY